MKTFLIPLLLLTQLVSATDQTLGEERDAAVRVQILLDQKMFGPGFIDGKPGTFTKRAVAAYNRSMGRAEDDLVAIQLEADALVSATYVTATVPRDAKRFVNAKLPTKREEQAKVSALSYRSYFEFMAERYHTSEDVLYELNGRKKTWGVLPGKTLVVPNVEPFKIEDIKPGRMHSGKNSELSKRQVIIDTKEKQIQIYEPIDTSVASNGEAISSGETKYRLVASFPTTPGQERYIHRGTWTLRNAIEWPTWRYDKQLLKEGKRGKEALNIPGGPNNPVGVLWAGLSKSGIGIHGTDSPRTIGRSQSSGCYRLANWDAVRIPQVIRPGATVIVK
ncbi:L,D-transpeptidase family protein [Roseibacillus persicicus]|uniref:Murein L,D-transpeptidase n=1 Tax=Roseibacillus persicicus TaxID=454148 RepID=A0A918TG54_9BACT|nr:L,D-transpeptidase [Roseibacillus persicicus]MDQ8190882.1 L,D-transpeptidase [Roseibacillus persicicus]GHC45315.1 murein L,D-transpeptidase [Roseibacillus persicicus]